MALRSRIFALFRLTAPGWRWSSAVIVVSSGLSVVGALLIKVVFDKALFGPQGPGFG